MSAQDLPDEIIAHILKSVPGEEVFRCRRVCRRWRDAVDNLPDWFWRSQCMDQDLSDEYAKVRTKHGLSWKATYKSLKSCNCINRLPVTKHKPAWYAEVNRFQILPNGVLALLKNLGHKDHYYMSDTVVYFNSNTNHKCDSKKYGYFFQKHEENEHFVVLQGKNERISIYTKHNEKWNIVPLTGDMINFIIFDNEVYSYSNDIIVLSKLVTESGEPDLKTEMLPNLNSNYLDVIHAIAKKNGTLYVLCYPSNEISILEDNTFRIVEQYVCDIDVLRKYGFDSDIGSIFDMLLHFSSDVNTSVSCAHGNILICSYTHQSHIDIFEMNNSFKYSDLEEKRPVRTIDLRKETNGHNILQMDVLETETHHKILMRTSAREIIIVEFPHCIEGMKLRSMAKKQDSIISMPDNQQLVKKRKRLSKKNGDENDCCVT